MLYNTEAELMNPAIDNGLGQVEGLGCAGDKDCGCGCNRNGMGDITSLVHGVMGLFQTVPGSCGALDSKCNPNSGTNILVIGGVALLGGWLLFGRK